jgi:hypothetical protein
MKTVVLVLCSVFFATLAVAAQHTGDGQPQPSQTAMEMHHHHSAGAAVSFAELKETLSNLERARKATAKYQDARVAEADGYRATGPDAPGMGIHFVLNAEQTSFDVEKPPILLYEKNPSVPGGFSLVGVSYLLNTPEGPDGQPLNSPFPKALASWHRHENICLMPDRTTPVGMSPERCTEKGGSFVPQTEWMVHAWIWRDSTLGIFSSTNPSVK